MSSATTAGDRELVIEKTLNAPIELVWEAFTNAEHIKNWWGPNGFTNTIFRMEVTEGGVWELVMHGPDGTDYKNKSVYKEIVNQKTFTKVRKLSNDERTVEIAKMLSGEKPSAVALENAKELLKN